jgi:hypothetical protein
MRWLRRVLGVTRTEYVPAPPVEPSHEEWLRGLLEELRTPEAERMFAGLDFEALFARPARLRAMLEPFTRRET